MQKKIRENNEQEHFFKWYLFLDAASFEETFVDSAPGGVEDHVREIFVPISNKNESIQYHLYTPYNQKEPCFIEPTIEEFDYCSFDPHLETKVLIHGFLMNVSFEKYFEVR